VTSPVPFVDLEAQRRRIRADVDRRIAAVLDHGRYILGPEVGELERRLAERSGVAEAVTCGSGTDALVMALLAWGVGPGDAVLVPTFTFVATAEAVALCGAVPVLCDVDEVTFDLDPEEIELGVAVARREGLRPVGVIAVDLFGLPAAYAALHAAARAHDLWVLADAAQSFGGSLDDVPVGGLAAVTATSFFPAKPLGCYGDGGALLTDDAEVAALLRSIRVHGQGTDKYDNVRIGINGRLDTVQAAVLLAKLEVFDDELVARQAVAERYRSALSELVQVPTVPSGSVSAWAQYTVRHPRRDELVARLADQGIPTAVYYSRPLHRQPGYQGFPTSSATLERADRLAATVVSLPMHPYLAPEVQDRVVEAVVEAVAVAGAT